LGNSLLQFSGLGRLIVPLLDRRMTQQLKISANIRIPEQRIRFILIEYEVGFDSKFSQIRAYQKMDKNDGFTTEE
jgi:hypothetical protein